MSSFKSEFLTIMHDRGYVHQITDLDGLDAKLSQGPHTAYIGFDATADSLHIGSLVQIMMLRWFQKCGHKPIALMGGGTTKVGDPSGKDESRQLLTEDKIASNIQGIRQIFDQLLSFDGSDTGAVMVNNDDWLSGLAYIDLLRDVGPHFTINRMMTFDSVKLRLDREQPLTFLEFNYMILQAYDFMELAKRHDCILQMGGSDQWGNIVNGMELSRRMIDKQLFGLTTPLITTADGKKMGKTADGAVWLNEDRKSSYDYWQFWRNTQDADVGRFLRLFTELPLDEIAKLEALQGQEINEAKIILANEATTLCRGAGAAKAAAETAQKTFSGQAAVADLPTFTADLDAGISVIDVFRLVGFGSSNGEIRRLIKGGGAKINDEKVTDETMIITASHKVDGSVKVSSGKKKHALLK